jgi:hypothetical protein
MDIPDTLKEACGHHGDRLTVIAGDRSPNADPAETRAGRVRKINRAEHPMAEQEPAACAGRIVPGTHDRREH